MPKPAVARTIADRPEKGTEGKTLLVFHRYGSTYFLAQVTTNHGDEACDLRISPEEQKLASARARLEKIRKAGLDNVKFAWMGGLEDGQGHYYRVQGSTFLIEFDNTQNDANHIHCVWRDFNGDWGADLLAEHYRDSPHHQHTGGGH